MGSRRWIPRIKNEKYIEKKVNNYVEELKKGEVDGVTYDKYPGKGDITGSLSITDLTTQIANSGNANITEHDQIRCAWLRK